MDSQFVQIGPGFSVVEVLNQLRSI